MGYFKEKGNGHGKNQDANFKKITGGAFCPELCRLFLNATKPFWKVTNEGDEEQRSGTT